MVFIAKICCYPYVFHVHFFYFYTYALTFHTFVFIVLGLCCRVMISQLKLSRKLVPNWQRLYDCHWCIGLFIKNQSYVSISLKEISASSLIYLLIFYSLTMYLHSSKNPCVWVSRILKSELININDRQMQWEPYLGIPL